jgi:hypothetical protein
MPIVTQCTAPGCETLTMGPLCVEHDVPVTRVFVRGRPLERKLARFARTYPNVQLSFAPSLRRVSERAVAARSLR